MVWTASVNGRSINIPDTQLSAFRKFYFDEELSSRVSDLIIADMAILDMDFGVLPQEVISSIRNLECGDIDGAIKAASMFKKPPLRGLWHKHYFSARFVGKNVKLALGKHRFENLVYEVMDLTQPFITKEMIQELAYRMSTEPLQRRAAERKITGEWIIFARHDNLNYYLSLDTHDAGDQSIFDRVMKFCRRDFPDLQEWITASATG